LGNSDPEDLVNPGGLRLVAGTERLKQSNNPTGAKPVLLPLIGTTITDYKL